MKIRNILFVLLFFFSINAYAELRPETIQYNDIEHIYICHEGENYGLLDVKTNQEMPTGNRFINNNPSSKLTIVNMSDKVLIRKGEDAPSYSYYNKDNPHKNLFASIIKNGSPSDNPCETHQVNVAFIIENIPPNSAPLLESFLIQRIVLSNSNSQNDEIVDSEINPRVEPANHNGIPSVPPVNFHPSASPLGNNPENPPPANQEEQTSDTNDQSLENKPTDKFSNKTENIFKITKGFNNLTSAEGCSLQVSGNPNANFSWSVWAFVLAGIAFFRSRKEFN